MARFDPSEYEPVEERIRRFYEKFPDGRIITECEMLGVDGKWLFKAFIYLDVGDQAANLPKATGYASEQEKGPQADWSAELGETSAIGRALANMNFSGNKKRASLEEMRKVPADYIALANATDDVEKLRLLWQQAKAANAPKDVLEAVKARAEELSGDAGVSEGDAGGVHGGSD